MSHYDWHRVRPGQVWGERRRDGSLSTFRVVSVSPTRARIAWPQAPTGWGNGSRLITSFRSCELAQDVEEDEEE